MTAPVLVGVPSNLTVTASNASVKLLWDLVNGAEFYRVEWVADPVPLVPASNGTVHHPSLTNGVQYTYTVTIGTEDIVLSATPAAAATNAPASVTITPAVRQNALSWTPAGGATGYRVYWSFSPYVTPSTGTRIDVGGQTSYVHADLEPGTPYFYIVTTVLANGSESPASARVGASPDATQSVSATASDGVVDLSWSSGAPAAVSVSTSQATDVVPFPFRFDPANPSKPIPITIPDLQNDRRYGISVRASLAGLLGPPSARVYATPKAPATGVPTDVTIKAGRGVNTIGWTPVSGATSYDVSWFAIDTNGAPIAGTQAVTGPTFRHSGLRVCTTLGPSCPVYSYVVRVSQSALTASEVGAVSTDLRPVPPLLTNADTVILTGIKPSGSRIEVDGTVAVPFDRETGWTHTVSLPLDGSFLFRLVAIDETGLASTETTYRVTRDTLAPAPPQSVSVTACDPATASPRRVTLAGTKEAGTAIYRAMEPEAADVLIDGATNATSWTGSIAVDNQTATIVLIAKDAAGNASLPVSVALSGCP